MRLRTLNALRETACSTAGGVIGVARARRAQRAASGDRDCEQPVGALQPLELDVAALEELDPAIRKAALNAITCQKSPAATQLLQELAVLEGPLGGEVKKELANRPPEQS